MVRRRGGQPKYDQEIAAGLGIAVEDLPRHIVNVYSTGYSFSAMAQCFSNYVEGRVSKSWVARRVHRAYAELGEE
jgi:hypothetical protein